MGAKQAKNGIPNAIIGDKNLAQNPLPQMADSRWQVAGKISNIYIYPVKSFHGVSVDSAIVEKHGLRHKDCIDRQFLGTY